MSEQITVELLTAEFEVLILFLVEDGVGVAIAMLKAGISAVLILFLVEDGVGVFEEVVSTAESGEKS